MATKLKKEEGRPHFKACRVTIEEIRNRLLETVPGLRDHGLGLTTVRYLFQSVHKGTLQLKVTKALLMGKLPSRTIPARSITLMDIIYCLE